MRFDHQVAVMTTYQRYMFSFPVWLSRTEIDWYKKIGKGYDDVVRQLANPKLSGRERLELEQQRRAMQDEVNRWAGI